MDKKLTLSLDAEVVERAKSYAKGRGVSLSRMIENYLSSITKTDEIYQETNAISPVVERLVGVVDLDEDIETRIKEEYTDYLLEKYK
ncbi:MAG: DUF6364 family protein [Bacteroidota bacterium]